MGQGRIADIQRHTQPHKEISVYICMYVTMRFVRHLRVFANILIDKFRIH